MWCLIIAALLQNARVILTRMETFYDGGSIDIVTPAQHAYQVMVQVTDLDLPRSVHSVKVNSIQ